MLLVGLVPRACEKFSFHDQVERGQRRVKSNCFAWRGCAGPRQGALPPPFALVYSLSKKGSTELPIPPGFEKSGKS